MSDLGVNFAQLRTAVDWSLRQLVTPRKNRVEAVREFVGTHYSDSGAEKRVPTNFLELAVTIYMHQLAARAPQVMVTTKTSTLRPFARNLELAMNQVAGEIDLEGTIQRAVMEALFSMGVVKVGLSGCGREVCGEPYGEPFVDIVELDDYFLDMSAKDRRGIQFEGNDYWIPLDDARAMWEGKGSEISPDKHTVAGEQGEDRAESVSKSEGADLYADKVWLRDVWIPSRAKVLTYGVKSLRVFQIVDWDGPDHGPYHTLGFSDVPGNILPLPPVSLWMDLHELANSLFRKLGRQADAKKTVAAFQGGNDDDVKALKAASDGEGIRYNGQKPEGITVGGIDAPTLAFYLQVRDLASYFAGNLDSLGGLGPSSETVGQDKLIGDAANARLNGMRGRTGRFAQGIFKSLAWYEWTDPVRVRYLEKPVKGSSIVLRVPWSAETRDGDFLEYNLDIDVHSMQADTPAVKLQKIEAAITNYILPLMPFIQQQGGEIDFKALVQLIADLGNTPELTDVIRFRDPFDVVPPSGSPEPTVAKPASTKRTYERVNRPGATRSGKDDVMSRVLMGVGVQGSEMATMGRRVS